MTTPRGRPRSASIDEAVGRAVVRSLADRGYAATTIEQVSREAKVPKTAIYRRWSSKAEMVFALVIASGRFRPPPERPTLAEDVHALVERVVDVLATPAAGQAVPGLLTDLDRDPSLRSRFHAAFTDPQRRMVATLLERAVRRGELGAMPDPTHVHAQLLGTVFAWTHLLSADPPEDLADRVTGALLASLR